MGAQKKITSKTSNFEVGQGELKGNKKNTSFAECYVHLFSINMNGINDFELYEAYLISVLFHCMFILAQLHQQYPEGILP